MVNQQKADRLLAFLGGLPETLALKLARAVELDRLADGRQLPHDLILAGLRPILRRALNADRTLTARRLFCRPFEDLLVDRPGREKLKGRIARSSIEPVWNWLSQSLLAEECAGFSNDVRTMVFAYRPQEAEDRAASFRAKAAEALCRALAAGAAREDARRVLGSETVLADADEMAILLTVAPHLRALQEAMPRPQSALTDDLLWTLRGSYDCLAAIRPDAAAYVAVIAMNRLERPWEALRLPLSIARQSQDTLISNTDMGLVGELLLGDLEAHAVAIRAVRQPDFDPDALVRHLTEFTFLSSGIVKEIEIRRDGKWGQRLMKDRAAVAEMMDAMMQRAPREILAALPTLKTGTYSGGPRAPDLSRPFDAEKGTRATTYAKLVAGSRAVAAAASIAASQAQAGEEVCAALKRYCEDIVRELRAAQGEQRRRVEDYFSLCVELTDILFSAEEGEFLRRRGRAALGTQAAA